MSLWKMDKSLKELHKKLEEERMLRELPGLVAGIEDAMCEQDMESQERLATIEDSLCELDAAVNKYGGHQNGQDLGKQVGRRHQDLGRDARKPPRRGQA